MTDDELDDWFQTGMRFFRDAFGYDTPAMPITDARDDNMEQCKRTLARSGAQIRSHTRNTYNLLGTPESPMGTYDPPGVLCMGWTARLDPCGAKDEDSPRGCSAAYERILMSWRCSMPAVVGGHRINYCSFDPKQVKEGHGQTERLLARISKEHPDAVYLTSAEVGQLYLMEDERKRRALLSAMDEVNDRYGERKLIWGSYIQDPCGTRVISPTWRPDGVRHAEVR